MRDGIDQPDADIATSIAKVVAAEREVEWGDEVDEADGLDTPAAGQTAEPGSSRARTSSSGSSATASKPRAEAARAGDSPARGTDVWGEWRESEGNGEQLALGHKGSNDVSPEDALAEFTPEEVAAARATFGTNEPTAAELALRLHARRSLEAVAGTKKKKRGWFR
jgi:hypothetical protein